MSGWDTDVALAHDEAGAQAIAATLTAAGISNIIVEQPETLPFARVSYHVKVQAKELTTARLALWFAGQGSLEGGLDLPARLAIRHEDPSHRARTARRARLGQDTDTAAGPSDHRRGACAQGHDVLIYSPQLAPIDWDDVSCSDLVGLSTTTSTAVAAYDIADKLRARGYPGGDRRLARHLHGQRGARARRLRRPRRGRRTAHGRAHRSA